MPADPTPPSGPAPAAADPWAANPVPAPNPADEATVPGQSPPIAVQPIAVLPIAVLPIPVQPVQVRPAPEKWSGRVAVPGAAGPGQRKAAPVAATAVMARPSAGPSGAQVTRRRSRRRSPARRFFGALVALLLLLAVPIVSAYVAYKLSSGENPFEWPPTVDYSNLF